MEKKQNKWGIVKGLAFPLGYTAYMNVAQSVLSVLLVFVVIIRSILAMMTYTGPELTPDTMANWYAQDNMITTLKYMTFFTALITVGALVILWLVFNRKGRSFAEYFRFTKAPVKAIFAAVLLGLSLHFLVNAVMLVLDPLTTRLIEALFTILESLDPSIAQSVRTYFDTYTQLMEAMSSDVGMFTLAAVLGAPLIEELIFRAGPLVNFKGKMPAWAALLITSALFGLAHGAPIQILYTFVVGLVLGTLFIKTDSIYPCIIGHFCFNAANLIPMAMEGLLSGPNQTPAMLEWLDAAYVIYSIAAAVIAIPMLIVGLVLLFTLRKPAPVQACAPVTDEQPDAEPAPAFENIPESTPEADAQAAPDATEQEENA